MSFSSRFIIGFLATTAAIANTAPSQAQSKPSDRPLNNLFGQAYRNAFGRLPPDATVGDRMLANYFHNESQALAGGAPAGVSTKSAATSEDWLTHKDQYRQQLFEMLGLDPVPLRTPLHATVTGTLEREDFRVEKVHFQSRPGLYVTANVYVPKETSKPMPAILYVCGHGQVKLDGVSYGNKVAYQHHGAWFARNGYVCIILDSVQLGEIEGIHHGTHNKGMWWWNSRGYTSAGAEAWNCIRALDYLQSRPDVDGQKMGVTGRSGGGAYSWWVAALDERIQAACPVAGITDLQNHVDDGCVEGHCDCMFMVNTYRWDYDRVAALVAPRPLLICNTDKDSIFPLDGVVRLHSKVRSIYDAYNAPTKLGLLITEGPHKDTQELQLPVMRWFNKWLKGVEQPITNHAEKLFEPKELKVFQEIPKDEITSRCFDGFTELAVESNAFDPKRALELLRSKTFGAWPEKNNKALNFATETLSVSESQAEGVRLRVFEFESQPGVRLRLYSLQPQDVAATSIHLEIADQATWEDRLEVGRVGFATALKEELETVRIEASKSIPPSSKEEFSKWMRKVRDQKMHYAVFAPRGVGLTALGGDDKYRTHLRRRFMLLGATLASSQVWDVHRASSCLRELPELRQLPLHFQASAAMTEVASFAALFEAKLESLTLKFAPRSDKESPDFLNWSRFVTPKQLFEMVKAKTTLEIDGIE